MRPDRLDHALGRHRAARAEIGRAKDRHIGDGAGMLDEIADAHDAPDDGDVGAQRRGGVFARQPDREKAGREGKRQCESADRAADHRNAPSQRISCAVVCSI